MSTSADRRKGRRVIGMLFLGFVPTLQATCAFASGMEGAALARPIFWIVAVVLVTFATLVYGGGGLWIAYSFLQPPLLTPAKSEMKKSGCAWGVALGAIDGELGGSTGTSRVCGVESAMLQESSCSTT